jgi:phage baseplate assembly protein W
MSRYININFPFFDSNNGFFLDLTRDDAQAIRADLMHLLLTRKGERFYNPEFGTNLLKYLYEPNDSRTYSDIKFELKETVRKYIPNLNIDEIEINPSETNEYKANIRIDYTITEDVFKQSDFLIINL